MRAVVVRATLFLGAFSFLWATAIHADELFGMSMQLDTPKVREEKLNAAEKLGVRWIRTTIIWEKFEPKQGKFDWKWFDDIVADAERHQIKLMATVLAISPWGSIKLPANYGKRGYQNVYPPKDMKRYGDFIRALAAHYKGRGIAWQIENEVNGKVFWSGTPDDYLTLLKTAYAAAHEGDPNCTVLPAGLSCSFSHLEGAQELQLRMKRQHEIWFGPILDTRAYDALDMHDYYLVDDPNAFGINFEQYIELYEGWLKEKNVRVPLWMSETGANSAPVNFGKRKLVFTPEQQARDLERIYAIARQHNIAHVLWLRLIDHEEAGFSFMGLIGENRKPKPALETYRRLASGK